MDSKQITDLISEYEKNQFNEIIKWETKTPNVVSRAFGWITKPLAWMIEMILPESSIRGALEASDWLAEKLTDSQDIMRDGGVSSIPELTHKDLKLSDSLADSVQNWALAFATGEGAAAGVAGLPGLVVDIPTLITLSLRTIHKIGLCYGYDCKTIEDKNFVFAIMAAANANTIKEKTMSIAGLQAIKTAILQQTWKNMTKKAAQNAAGLEAGIIGLKALAKRVGINLTKRKALESIPYIGAGVGATVNFKYINDISWAARRQFQERWLIDNKKIIIINSGD